MAFITINSVLGNIFHDRRLLRNYRCKKAERMCERLLIARAEMERVRLRRKTDMGTDIGIVLEPGGRLEHGDVLFDGKDKFIIVEQLPEKVISVTLKEKGSRHVQLSALVGHAAGNRHRPIAIDNGTISFPVMADSELEVFKKLLPAGHMQIKIEEKVFLPSGDVHTHEH